jgi:hypothetical protein
MRALNNSSGVLKAVGDSMGGRIFEFVLLQRFSMA